MNLNSVGKLKSRLSFVNGSQYPRGGFSQSCMMSILGEHEKRGLVEESSCLHIWILMDCILLSPVFLPVLDLASLVGMEKGCHSELAEWLARAR